MAVRDRLLYGMGGCVAWWRGGAVERCARSQRCGCGSPAPGVAYSTVLYGVLNCVCHSDSLNTQTVHYGAESAVDNTDAAAAVCLCICVSLSDGVCPVRVARNSQLSRMTKVETSHRYRLIIVRLWCLIEPQFPPTRVLRPSYASTRHPSCVELRSGWRLAVHPLRYYYCTRGTRRACPTSHVDVCVCVCVNK